MSLQFNTLKQTAESIDIARSAFTTGASRSVTYGNKTLTASYPFPSPGDWRDCPIYFLMIDRFCNPDAAPAGTWNQRFDYHQGGTFKGITHQLDYIADLGMKALWISPVVKNARPDEWAWNYHGYGAQNLIAIDERFGSEQDLQDLVTAAHAKGIYVILDIVLNHTARVFDYVFGDSVVSSFSDGNIINGGFGSEPSIRWLNGYGYPRSDWQNTFAAGTVLSADDAVYPDELRNHTFFRRRGDKVSDAPDASGFVKGDFGVMRQLVVEYDASVPGQEQVRKALGVHPVLSIMVQSYAYLVARFDFDGFRIDTVKYVHPKMVQYFGNAMREFALSIGKRNFFTFGEVYDDEQQIASFVGRNGENTEGFGIDAALDFPLFYKLPGIAKAQVPVEVLQHVFEERKHHEKELISSHGEAGRFFVSFLDNHDQKQRFKHPHTPNDQIIIGLALLYSLQGIPCIYYGTEQGLDGTENADATPDLNSLESVREALWGKPNAFHKTTLDGNEIYTSLSRLGKVRHETAALRYGRLYFRQVSGNGNDFGYSQGQGGIVAFSRILAEQEVVIIANTHWSNSFKGFVLIDPDLHQGKVGASVLFDSVTSPQTTVTVSSGFHTYWQDGNITGVAEGLSVNVNLEPMQVMYIMV